jgi:hypothetical protein
MEDAIREAAAGVNGLHDTGLESQRQLQSSTFSLAEAPPQSIVPRR